MRALLVAARSNSLGLVACGPKLSSSTLSPSIEAIESDGVLRRLIRCADVGS